jgi:hypothetical protein
MISGSGDALLVDLVSRTQGIGNWVIGSHRISDQSVCDPDDGRATAVYVYVRRRDSEKPRSGGHSFHWQPVHSVHSLSVAERKQRGGSEFL